jgi:hypothetical protein
MPSLLLLLPLLVFTPRTSHAIATCPAPAAIAPRILNCGKNPVATQFAATCARQVLAEEMAAGRALQLVMADLSKKIAQAQSGTMTDARQRLELAITTLTGQILNLQKNTDTLASYAQVMVDVPSSTGDATSLQCFNPSFHALQKVVSRLDDEIIASKRARTTAIALATMLADQEGNLNASFDPAVRKEPVKDARSTPSGKSQQQRSWVTGVEDDMRKNEKQP